MPDTLEQNDNFSIIWEKPENLKSKLRKDRNNDFDGDENDLGPVIITPSGIIPVHAKNIANFDFWILHTSFRLTEYMILELDFVDGVETLQVISPYRIQLSFGKTFNTDIAKQSVEECLRRCYNVAGSVRMDLLKKMLKSKYAFYAIGIENDNVMQGFGGSTKQEVESILKDAQSKYNFSKVFKSYE